MTPSDLRPRVLVPACNRLLGEHPFHVVGRKYVDAVRLAGGLPVVVPYATADDLDDWLALADGILLTGSPSNVHPSHFEESVLDPSLPLDPDRDEWTLPLIRAALARGVPLFAICRGTQEVNVALGGSLHQAVHAVTGHLDHRSVPDQPASVQYAPIHDVLVEPGGVLETLVGAAPFAVNSLHGQAVHRLATGLQVEARSPDGVVEAFSAPASPGFALCVQWHPEWQAARNTQSMQLLSAFGEACHAYRRRRATASGALATPAQVDTAS